MHAKRTIRHRAETEQNRLDLLRIDIQMCHTLAGIAVSELGCNNHEHASRALARASKGCANLEHIFELRKSWAKQPTDEITAKLTELRQLLDHVQKKCPMEPWGRPEVGVE